MDAVKYLEESNRMHGRTVTHKEVVEVVDGVEQWSKEHPAKRRVDVFLKMFPNSSPSNIRKCDMIGIESCDHVMTNCNKCRTEYWVAEAPADFGKGGVK